MNNGTQNYVLTKKQLYILLVGCGGESVRGLKIDGDVPDKAEIIKAIGELSDRGYVVSDGNNFHTVGDIDKIIKLIMFAPDFYIIKGRNNVPDLCCYGDKKQFAVCEVMVTKADSIRISVCDFESLFSKLFDEGYFENCFDEYFVGDDELREFEARYLEKRDISCENNGSSRRVFSIDKIRSDGTDRYIDIVEYFLCDYILDVDGENVKRKQLSNSEMKKSIKNLLEESV